MRLAVLSALLLGGLVAADVPRQRPLGRLSSSSSSSSSSASPPIYRDDLVALHRGLVETASVTGTEEDVGVWLEAYLAARNYTVVRQPVTTAPLRFNIVAWPGRVDVDLAARRFPAARVLVSSHIDVVPPHIPYGIADDGDHLTADTVVHGRGSVDAKGSVAAQVTAVEALRAAGQLAAGDVALLYVVGEEDGGDGMLAFSAAAPPPFDAAIFGEPTENRLACGHKGILGCTVTAVGRAGHSGYPWLGKSANEVLLRGLLAILDRDLGSSALYGNTTVNIGRMDGGVAGNVIPAHAAAAVAIRVALGPQASGHEVVRTRIEAALAGVDAEALTADCGHGYGVVDCACDVEGFDTIIANYGTDIPNLAGNHTRYLYGPGSILVAHSDHEALTIGDLETAVEGYKTLILHALQ